jgi:hypothetical protein
LVQVVLAVLAQVKKAAQDLTLFLMLQLQQVAAVVLVTAETTLVSMVVLAVAAVTRQAVQQAQVHREVTVDLDQVQRQAVAVVLVQ